EGAHVDRGQTLLAVAGSRSSQAMGDTNAVVAAKLRYQQVQLRATLKELKSETAMKAAGLRQHKASLAAQIAELTDQIRLQHKQVQTAANLVERVTPLHRQGIVSSVEFDQYQADALTQKSRLKSFRQQRLSLKQQRK